MYTVIVSHTVSQRHTVCYNVTMLQCYIRNSALYHCTIVPFDFFVFSVMDEKTYVLYLYYILLYIIIYNIK